MILDLPITYRVDFVPKRARNAKQGCTLGTISVSVREVPGSSAPHVLSFGERGSMIAVRELDGLLYMKANPFERDGARSDVSLESVARNFVRKHGLDVETDRRSHPFEDSATATRSHRDVVAAAFTEWAAESLAIVDGVLHSRTASHIVPARAVAKAFRLARTDPLFEAYPDGYIPAFFQRNVEGAPLTEWLSRSPGVPRDVGILSLRLNVEIQDVGRVRELSENPKNTHWAMIGQEGMPVHDHVVSTRDRDDLLPRSTYLQQYAFHSIAGRISEGRASVRDAEKLMIAMFPRKPDFDRKAPFGMNGDRNGSRAYLLGPTALQEARASAPTPDGVPGTFGQDDWNLRVAACVFLGMLDGRIGLLDDADVDAISRIAGHLVDWRASPSTAFEPERDARFVLDMVAFERILSRDLFYDIGDAWSRTSHPRILAEVAARVESTPVVENDAVLSNFSF